MLYSKFKDNDNPLSIVNGIKEINGEKFLYYVELENITIETINKQYEIDAFGTNGLNIKTYGIFHLFSKNIENDYITLVRTMKSEVHAIVSLEENDFSRLLSIQDKRLLKVDKNPSFNKRTITLTASFFLSKKYTTELTITQLPNTTQETIVNEKTNDIVIKPSKQYFSRFGGNITLDVEHIFVTKHQEIDMYGNIIREYEGNARKEKCTSKCTFLLQENINGFSLKKNVITASSQNVNAPSRNCTLIVEYNGISKKITFMQEEGGKLSNKTLLTFKENIDSITCNEIKEYSVPIISSNITLVNKKETKRINNKNIKITNHPSWVNASLNENNSEFILTITPTMVNDDKYNERKGIVIIENDKNDKLSLILSQNPNTIKNALYDVIIDSVESYTEETIKDARIALKGQITNIYNNGDEEITYVNNIDSDFVIKCKTLSTNEEYINGGKIASDGFGCEFYYKPFVNDIKFNEDVTQSILFWIEDIKTNKRVSDYKEIKLYIKAIRRINIPITVKFIGNGDECWTKEFNKLIIVNKETNQLIQCINIKPFWLPINENEEMLYNDIITLEEDKEYVMSMEKDIILYPSKEQVNKTLEININDIDVIEYNIKKNKKPT